MRSKETLIVGVVIVITVAVLAVLFALEQGQKIPINQSLTTSEGIKLTIHEGRFRSIDPTQTDLILKGTVENTADKSITPFSRPVITPPEQPQLCCSDNYPTSCNESACVTRDSQEYQDYLKRKADYDAAIFKYAKEKQDQEVRLLTPRNSTASNDYGRIGGEQDLAEILNSDFRALNPNESIDGILVFNVNQDEKGSYVLKYKNQQLSFQVNE